MGVCSRMNAYKYVSICLIAHLHAQVFVYACYTQIIYSLSLSLSHSLSLSPLPHPLSLSLPLSVSRPASCGSVVCTWGARCVQDKCECPQCLDEDSAPVCGSDGLTYDSACELQSASCVLRKNIRVAKSGSCDEGEARRRSLVPTSTPSLSLFLFSRLSLSRSNINSVSLSLFSLFSLSLVPTSTPSLSLSFKRYLTR